MDNTSSTTEKGDDKYSRSGIDPTIAALFKKFERGWNYPAFASVVHALRERGKSDEEIEKIFQGSFKDILKAAHGK